MTYAVIKPLSCEPTKLRGLSEKLIVSHWENNYGGAVRRLNAITAQLAELDFARAPIFVLNGLKYEHSYPLDYGASAERYVDAFMENINWAHVARLFEAQAPGRRESELEVWRTIR